MESYVSDFHLRLTKSSNIIGVIGRHSTTFPSRMRKVHHVCERWKTLSGQFVQDCQTHKVPTVVFDLNISAT